MMLESTPARRSALALDPAIDPCTRARSIPRSTCSIPRTASTPKPGRQATARNSAEVLRGPGARANRLIDEALARLAKIEKGEGDYKDDEPFVVPGSGPAWPAPAGPGRQRLMSKTHAPHMLLKADGTRPVQIIPQVWRPDASRRTRDSSARRPRTSPSGITCPSSPAHEARLRHDREQDHRRPVARIANSVPGNRRGHPRSHAGHAGTCAAHLVFSEIAFDHSAAKDKEFVGVEGAGHFFQPCRPEYGDTFRRAFDYIDSWLTKPGRFDQGP